MTAPSIAPPIPALIRPHMPSWLAVLIACVASFMVVMDGAIVNVALPAMRADLHLTAVTQQWVVDAYLLALGGFMLLAARASDLFGRKVVLQSGLFVFTAASLLGGLADNGTALLIARAVQGLGASALATSTLAVIVAVYPQGVAKERAISLWAASSAMASAFGVVIGGVLTASASWRWVMFVNVPVGALLMALVAACLLPKPPGANTQRLDIPGAITVTLGLASLIYGITQSASQGWVAPAVQLAVAVGVVLLGLFCWVEARSKQPLIRLDIFQLGNVRMGNLVVLCLGAALTASMFFISIVLQQVIGYSALETGLAMLPMSVALAIAAISSRYLMDAGVRRLPFFGGLTAAAGLIWLSTVPAQAVYLADLFGPTLLVGTGLGLMIMTATHTALAGIPRQDAGLASGLLNTARQLGGALGVAGLSTYASSVTKLHGVVSPVMALPGYHAAFLAIAVIIAVSGGVSLLLKRL